jgi:hypothetical protein
MIRSVKITNYRGESIELELTRPEKSGFYIQEITGLGPPKADVNTTEIATTDGAFFNSARAQSRNVVLTLGFLFQPDVETVRQLSYKYFPVKKPLTLTVAADNRVGEIFGYVESNEPDIFSDRQTTQISIICPDPFIYSKRANVTDFVSVTPMFEFEFSNESLSEDLLEMGSMLDGHARSVFYEGDAEVGVVIYIYAFGPVSNLTILNPESNQKMEIDDDRLIAVTGARLTEGDQVIISTIRGDKSITLLRDGAEYNILNALNRDAYWFQLEKGGNIFAYSADFGLANVSFRIENRVVYEGV